MMTWRRLSSLAKARRGAGRALLYTRAWLHRLRMSHITYVGVTGSSGKTTAKSITATMLSAFGPCAQTERAENEPSFVARAVLETTRQHRYCVAEIAASEQFDLALPARLLKPNIAVVTLVAREHYRGSLDGVAAEKEKLITALRPGGIAVLNIDDPRVRTIGERCNARVVWIGKAPGTTLRLIEARSRYPEPLRLKVEHDNTIFEVDTQLHGEQLALPVLAALGVAVAANLPLDQAIKALAKARPHEGRMQIVAGEDGVVFIRDDWKAPHWSIESPLAFLKAAEAKRKVAIIGSISDSPRSPSQRYAQIARLALQAADLVLFVGPDSRYALKAKPANEEKSLLAFPDVRAAAEYLKTSLRSGDLVLLKGQHQHDHLVRIILDRKEAIQCWRDDCRLPRFCNRCSKLRQAVVLTPSPA